MNPLISVVIPVVRPEKAKRCIAAAFANAGAYAERMEVVSEEDTDRIGCPRMVKRLAEKTRGEFFCFLGDDTIPQPGWLDAAMAAMATLPDGWGLVGMNDGVHNGRLATHWVASKKLLPSLGDEFFHVGYKHLYCDKELTERCQEMGRYVYSPGSMIAHDHPACNGGKGSDEVYDWIYKSDVAKHDQALFWRRKRCRVGFKLALGFPVVDPNVPVSFFLSVMGLELPDNTIMVTPVFPHGPMPHDIAAARESLVHQAMEEGCTHLCMMDTDQIYPPDTIKKLLSHDKSVVGVRVHRRWPPFDPIFKRGTLGDYHYVGDEEAFSGRLVDVDATGTGCLLFNMDVFDRIDRPWFTFGSHDGNPVGEDIWLCHRLRHAGVGIFIDTSIEVGHLAQHVVDRSTYMLFSKLNPPNK